MQGKTVQNQLTFNEAGDLEIINPSDPEAGFREVWRKKGKVICTASISKSHI